MTHQLLQKVREIEAAAGPNWIAPFKDVNDIADLRARLAQYNVQLDDAVAEEAMELIKSSGVRELSDNEIEKVAGGAPMKII
jgi:hypothetical protein